MLSLPNVTMCIVDTLNYGLAVTAIKKSLHQIAPARTIFFTDIKAYNPNFPFEIVKIDKIASKADYSRFIMKELYKHIKTDYVLIIQYDGYVLNADAWSDDFLTVDYLGAAWLENDGYNVGNGGFSIRSKKLLEAIGGDDFIEAHHPEDATICRLYRPYLESKYGIRFGDDALADRFAFELREPICPTFGFHGNFHKPYKETVVVRRSGALGDCVAIEPVLKYYHDKGYKVAIDMPLHIALIYAQHHYPVFHISQLDKRIPAKVIDLDMSYENNPKQLHLKSYFETAGVTDYKLENPQLNFKIHEHNKLFKKYITLHIDDRAQPHRNAYGIDWQTVVAYLNDKGYTVIQVGLTSHEAVKGAVQMQTCTTNLLMWVIAGADFSIGVDSGPASISVALGVPAVILFGSVNPEYIHPDLSKVKVIQNECQFAGCWHNVIGVDGQDCVFDVEKPPCTQFTTKQVFDALKDLV